MLPSSAEEDITSPAVREEGEDGIRYVMFVLTSSNLKRKLKRKSLEDRQFKYTVTDPDGNSAEGVVELRLWTMPSPPDLVRGWHILAGHIFA